MDNPTSTRRNQGHFELDILGVRRMITGAELALRVGQLLQSGVSVEEALYQVTKEKIQLQRAGVPRHTALGWRWEECPTGIVLLVNSCY